MPPQWLQPRIDINLYIFDIAAECENRAMRQISVTFDGDMTPITKD
jgi:hypothetical protein